MSDYTNLGLDSNLQPISSPITNNGVNNVNGYDFNSNNERNTVTGMNIRDFNFSTGKGGTLTLGGTVNGNGFLLVDNNGGTEIVRIDNNGIAVSEGSISIKNSSGSTMIDSYGIVSSTNFRNNKTIEAGLNQSITPSSFTDVTNSSYSITLARAATILFIYSVDMFLVESAGNTGNGVVVLDIDGTNESQIIMDSGNTHALTLTGYLIMELSAATHAIKLEGKLTATAGSPVMTIRGFTSSYIILGA